MKQKKNIWERDASYFSLLSLRRAQLCDVIIRDKTLRMWEWQLNIL